jgi:hypothetical protein
MKHTTPALAILALLLAQSVPAARADDPPAAVKLSDGALATAYDHCGEADLCAKIKYANGDALLFYSEGAALGQPYYLLAVRTHAKQTFFQYARRLENIGTQLTLDHGLATLNVYLNKDGTLRSIFTATKRG